MEVLDDIPHGELFYFNKPGLMERMKSTLIDACVVIFLLYLASMLLNSLGIESGVVKAFFLVLVFLYEPIAMAMDRTIGQRMMGLKVVNFSLYKNNDKTIKINILSSLVRYAAKLFLGWISLLTIHSDKYGQAIHDKLGNSVVLFS
jgi:uncharacterized RDD family membrane protein YckC